MKRTHFDMESDGFYGVYWKCKEPSDCALIVMLGDDPENFMVKACVKWVLERGVNAMSIAPAACECGYHNFPLERIEAAILWLQGHGVHKIGIVGASTTGTLALTAASYFSEITLTIALTPSDFMWQGFMKGKKDGCKEWPIEGEALVSYHGGPLPYMPFAYQHPQYWQCVASESRRTGDMVNSRKLFDDSERAYPVTEAEIIKIEKICGKLLLIGAKDDVLWNTAKYIRRMEKRLTEKPHDCDMEAIVYEHGTHFVFPEGVMKKMLPIGSSLMIRLAFKAAKNYPKECKAARADIDRRITKVIGEWKMTHVGEHGNK